MSEVVVEFVECDESDGGAGVMGEADRVDSGCNSMEVPGHV